MKRLFFSWILSVAVLLPLAANASPRVIKELTGQQLSSMMRQVFQMPGSLLTLAEKSFVVIKPAVCYGAQTTRICRVALGYPVEETSAHKQEELLPSLKQIMTVTYKSPASPPGASLTIISAIQYF